MTEKVQRLRTRDPYFGIEDQDPGLDVNKKLTKKPKLDDVRTNLQIQRTEEQKKVSWQNRWRLRHLTVVEQFYFALKDNRVHPFVDLGSGFYYIILPRDDFYIGWFIIILSIFCFIVFSLFLGVFSFTVCVFLISLCIGFRFLHGNFMAKELIISRTGGYIVRMKKTHKVIIEEPINNIYIKMMKTYDSNQSPHYYIILGGYNLPDVRLTGFEEQFGPLRLLAKTLARRMGLNFFDTTLNSHLHRIYHFPGGRSTIQPTEDQYSRFLKSHKLTKKQVRKEKWTEGIPEAFDTVPSTVFSKVLENYARPPAERLVRGMPRPNKEDPGAKKRRQFDHQRRLSPTGAGPTMSELLILDYRTDQTDLDVREQFHHAKFDAWDPTVQRK